MALGDMKVFNDYLTTTTIETLAQLVDKFNAASNGTIRLTAEGFDGDYFMQSFFASLHSAQRRVDRYASNTSAASTNLAQNQHNSVKVAGGFGPIAFEPGQMTWIQEDPARAIEAISQNLAEAMLKDQLNTTIAALVAAIQNQATAKYDAWALSPKKPITQSALNKAHAKFGDHSSLISAEVMSGATFHKLIGQNLANAENLYRAADVTVVDILGRRVIVTDAPALTEAVSGADDKEKVLGLTVGAATVSDGGDLITNTQTTNGKLRIETTFQADYTFMLGLKGYAWDTTSGGKSPTDAELATGSNWDVCVSSIKHTAGVIAIGDADLDA